jgi:hypothetical protein
MSKETTKETVQWVPTLKEVCVFAPQNGQGKEDVTIVALPEEGKTKYSCLFAGGVTLPVNACYLEKK